MPHLAIIADLRVQDVLDILFLSVVAYHLYVWFAGTKAVKALIGLAALGIIFTAARSWGLFLTTWVFQILWQVLIILLIILFQSEIRQVLERMNPLRMIGLRAFAKTEDWIPSLVEAVFSLAQRKIGALMIIVRGDRVEEWVTGGLLLDGEPGPQLLLSIFQKESPLHDGAVVIRAGRVVLVAGYLPLSSAEGLPKEWGTRHRAALGLSERCDAWVVVVSEERGEVSLARGGEMVHIKSSEELSKVVMEAVEPPRPREGSGRKRIRSLIVNRWRLKAGTVGLVSAVWLLLAGQQDFEVTVPVPVQTRNLPSQMEIVEPLKPVVRVKVRGLRKDASTLNERNVHAEIDLSLARSGARAFRVTRDEIILPNDRVQIVNIEPSLLSFQIRNKHTEKPGAMGAGQPGRR